MMVLMELAQKLALWFTGVGVVGVIAHPTTRRKVAAVLGIEQDAVLPTERLARLAHPEVLGRLEGMGYRGVTNRAQRIVPMALDAWNASGVLMPDEQAILLSFMVRESRFDPAVIGDTHLRDTPLGQGGGLIGFRNGTLQWLIGIGLEDILPQNNSDQEVRRVVGLTTRACEAYLQVRPRWAGTSLLDYSRANCRADWRCKARLYRTAWWAGHSRQYAELDAEKQSRVELVVPLVEVFRQALGLETRA